MALAHSREMVLAAFELQEAGFGHNQIRKELKVGKGTVQRWFSEPRLNPYLDDIAIERAIGGDIPVYDALTHFEREVVLLTLQEKAGDLDFAARFGSDAPRIRDAVQDIRERDAARARRADRKHTPRPKGVTVKRRGPEFDAKVVQLHGEGRRVPDIAREIGASVATVRRALKDAA